MPSFNQLTLMGNLTRDVELRYAQNGTAFAKGGIAVTKKFRDQEKTLFLDFTAFGKTAEILQKYTSKGSAVLLAGELELSQWEDKTTGQKRQKHEMVVLQVQFAGSKSGQGGRGRRAPDEDGPPADLPGESTPPEVEDDIPF